MKVELEEKYRDIYTLSELDAAKKVIKEMKEVEDSANELGAMAAREALKNSGVYVSEIIWAKATTARNLRVYDYFGEGSGHMDIWIEATARTTEGFIDVGAYLSEIWQIGTPDLITHMYVVRYCRRERA